MENLDLNLTLGLPASNETIEFLLDTSLSLKPPASDSVLAIGGVGSGDRQKESSNNILGRLYDENTVNNMNVNLMVSEFIMKKFSPTSLAAAATTMAGASGEVNPPLAPPNGYVMLDVPPRRAERERALANALEVNVGGPNNNGRGRGNRHNRGENFNEENKRCTNINCNTTDTPMWRRGPLGPKTLCNACGIKYRKEGERKKAREAARRRENDLRFRNNQFRINFID